MLTQFEPGIGKLVLSGPALVKQAARDRGHRRGIGQVGERWIAPQGHGPAKLCGRRSMISTGEGIPATPGGLPELVEVQLTGPRSQAVTAGVVPAAWPSGNCRRICHT